MYQFNLPQILPENFKDSRLKRKGLVKRVQVSVAEHYEAPCAERCVCVSVQSRVE